ncbi:MAG: LysE family transporter [Alphaproteobacteria bacterium]
MSSIATLVGSGVLLGWSVAWPPGPINAEMARRCLTGGFWAGYGLILGACVGDGLWAVVVALGVGVLFTGPVAQTVLGVLSLGLLAMLAVTFAHRAFAAYQGQPAAAAARRFDTGRTSFVLGATLALTSPWNVTFWLAAMGRPEIAGLGLSGLLLVAVSVMAGATAWGLLWAGTVTLLREKVQGSAGRWAAVVMNGATAALMLCFLIGSARRLIG